MLLDRPLVHPLEVDVDHAAARRSLRDQVAHLERQLVALQCSEWAVGAPARVEGVRSRGGGARLLSLEELEELRDELDARLREARAEAGQRERLNEEHRVLRERMLLDPAAHRWQVVRNEQCGERACGAWHVRPRFGLIGMLANWWRVVVSSGCP